MCRYYDISSIFRSSCLLIVLLNNPYYHTRVDNDTIKINIDCFKAVALRRYILNYDIEMRLAAVSTIAFTLVYIRRILP